MAPQRIAGPGEINHRLFDPYSLVHGLVGVVALLVGLSFWQTLTVAVGWELVEHAAKNVVPGFFPHPTQDTLANSVGDVLSTMAAWTVAWTVSRAVHRRSRDGRRRTVAAGPIG
jgi:hypothetical protein